MDKKIVVFIKCKIDPSSYYRLYQYFRRIEEERTVVFYEQIPEKVYLWYYNSKHFSKLFAACVFWMIGVIRTIYFIEKDKKYFHSDVLVLNRKFFARKMPAFLKNVLRDYLKEKKLIWDFDDNIIDDKEISKQELELVSEFSKRIIVTNQYLRKRLNDQIQKKVILLPTTDFDLYSFDYRKNMEEKLKIYETCINLIWVGSKNNVKYLEMWIAELDRIVGEIKKKICLYVVCNKEFHWLVENMEIINIEWNREVAIKVMQKCHVGLMPLKEDAYTLGKAGFKVVQYFGAGIPAVVSAVGYNKRIVKEYENGYLIGEKEKLEKIKKLIENKETWEKLAINARNTYEEQFNPKVILNTWRILLDSVEKR